MSVPIAERLRGQQDVQLGRSYVQFDQLIHLDREMATQRTHPDFSQIQETLDTVIGAHLPDTLVESLRFGQLNWIGISHPDAYSALFIGVPKARHQRYEIDEAEGVIEIARHKWGRAKSSEPSYLDKSHVRVAGVYVNQGGMNVTVRPIAIDYREDWNNSAQQILVGVTSYELAEDPAKVSRNRLTQDIPFYPQVENEDFRRDTGLITPAMIEVASGTLRPMKQAIRVGAGYYPRDRKAWVVVPRLAQEYGFYSGVFNGNMGVVGFQVNGSIRADRYGYDGRRMISPAPWGIAIPLELQRP